MISMGSRRPRMSDVLYGDLLNEIKSGQLGQNERLPSEKEFCERFGVSRPIVREALERLRKEGLIQSRQGAGSFVVNGVEREPARQGESAVLPPQIHSILDIQKFYEYRISIEGETAFQAAKNRTEADIARIASLLERIVASSDGSSVGVEADLEFHAAIADATHNGFLIATWKASLPHLRFIIDLARSLSALKSARHAVVVRTSHEPILAAIQGGDSERARRAMQDHIIRSRERVFHGK